MTVGHRLYRLRPWLVRALIPAARPGSYVLYALVGNAVTPRYNGRSDRDLAGRLSTHARLSHGDYFSYDVHHSAETAYLAECAGFHLRTMATTNLIHPATPRGRALACPFCLIRGQLGRGHLTNPTALERTPAAVTNKEV